MSTSSSPDRPASPPENTPLAAAPEGAARLADWGLIRARGDDAASFLQGQLTQDIAGLPAGRATLAGYCSAKGRLMASFVAWKAAPDEVLLACSADLLAPTLKRLQMFVLRARCKLSDAGAGAGAGAGADEPADALVLWGLAGPAATDWLADAAGAQPWDVSRRGAAQVVRLPDALGQARYLYVAPASAAPDASLPALAADDWRWLEVHSGVVRVTAATSERFVPQMVNFELVGGVSFKKGCYPGQEVVARSQYRGTLKRRAFLYAGDLPMAEGQEVFHDADPGQPAGQIALAAHNGRIGGTTPGHVALIELKRALVDAGTLHLGDAGGALLHRLPLPYEIPADEA